jgi:hypothetical protein
MYRLHLQAQWPRRFNTLAGAIAHIRYMLPLWYVLEEWQGDAWEVIVSRDESRLTAAYHVDPGVMDQT